MWGKIIGSFAGFAMGGPFGAVFGAAAGHAYDKLHEEPGQEHLLPDGDPPGLGAATYEGENSRAARQTAFSIAVVVLAAKVAKVDGPVNRREINAFKEVFQVPPEEAGSIGRIFDASRQNAAGFEPYAQQMAILFRREPTVLEELLASLFYIACADGDINSSEMGFLHRVADLFALEAASFERVRAMFIKPGTSADPYGVLGISRAASDREVKDAYRHLIREHHPDTLFAKGLPKSFIEIANRKMAAINAAYDQIQRERRSR